MNIAILGATSYIAKGLIYNFLTETNYELTLFGRNSFKIKNFIDKNNFSKIQIKNIDNFSYTSCKYDVIINCIISEDSIFEVSEKYDNLIIDYLKINPKTLYINFSSGAIYGQDFIAPVEIGTKFNINTNELSFKENRYAINKLYLETKHRAYSNLNIIDIRLFGYFSRFINLESHYFLSQIINCIKNKKIFVTTSDVMIRDFIGPDDLFYFIQCCINKKKINTYFDTYSLEEINKIGILDFFKLEYGLNYEIKDSIKIENKTGIKKIYYSNNCNAKIINYYPIYTSLETIKKEVSYIL